MGLARALVDRARRVYAREDPSAPWREGTPPGQEAFGPWFAVRFRPVSASEQGNGVRVEEGARLLIGLRDESGAALVKPDGGFGAFDADDMLEVVSAELGSGRWHVQGAPQAMRRRRSLVGFRAELRKAREAGVEEGPLLMQLDVPLRVEAPVLADEPTGADLGKPAQAPAGVEQPDEWAQERG